MFVLFFSCLTSKSIDPLYTRDNHNKGRFHLFNPFKTYRHDENEVDFPTYYKDSHFPGFEEFSEETITLHHMTPNDLITADLFMYRIKTSILNHRVI